LHLPHGAAQVHVDTPAQPLLRALCAGRLFDYVAESPLAENTYIMIMSDNGAELFPTERKGKDKLVRCCFTHAAYIGSWCCVGVAGIEMAYVWTFQFHRSLCAHAFSRHSCHNSC
jgi:arylsulfatase A-like enzyme